VKTVKDFSRAVTASKKDAPVLLLVDREGSTMFLAVQSGCLLGHNGRFQPDLPRLGRPLLLRRPDHFLRGHHQLGRPWHLGNKPAAKGKSLEVNDIFQRFRRRRWPVATALMVTEGIGLQISDKRGIAKRNPRKRLIFGR
jgi:hypothetical protein